MLRCATDARSQEAADQNSHGNTGKACQERRQNGTSGHDEAQLGHAEKSYAEGQADYPSQPRTRNRSRSRMATAAVELYRFL